MRYAVLGDIHANLEALEAVLDTLSGHEVDAYLMVGDVVGYGADPRACIQILRDLRATVVAGNHDWAAIGKLDTAYFNPYARAAIDWTRDQLSIEDRSFLEDLPLVQRVEDEITLVHATLDQPEVFDYILSYYDAQRSLRSMQTRTCFVGHSHVPVAFLVQNGVLTPSDATAFSLKGAQRALINVGSIGQPRDENPEAAVAVFDSTTLEYTLLRVPYDIDLAGQKILDAGLPRALSDRLLVGQ